MLGPRLDHVRDAKRWACAISLSRLSYTTGDAVLEAGFLKCLSLQFTKKAFYVYFFLQDILCILTCSTSLNYVPQRYASWFSVSQRSLRRWMMHRTRYDFWVQRYTFFFWFQHGVSGLSHGFKHDSRAKRADDSGNDAKENSVITGTV